MKKTSRKTLSKPPKSQASRKAAKKPARKPPKETVDVLARAAVAVVVDILAEMNRTLPSNFDARIAMLKGLVERMSETGGGK